MFQTQRRAAACQECDFSDTRRTCTQVPRGETYQRVADVSDRARGDACADELLHDLEAVFHSCGARHRKTL